MAIKLEKQGDSHSIDLTKSNNSQPLIVHVNLDWEELENKSSGLLRVLFSSPNQAADLDLGCMYEMQNGAKGVIQPLGGNFGSKTSSPYIFLDQDDRTGATAGENMYIFRPDLIKRVMFFAFIYEGAPDFKSVQGRMLFKVNNGEEVYLELNNPDSNRSFCAAALIKNVNSQVVIVKEEKYFTGHKEADKYYQFGFNWTSGRK